MNKPTQVELGIPVLCSVIGFFFTGGLSLAAGNSVMTSILRGAVGLFGAFLLGYIIRFAIRTFVGSTVQEQEEVRGKHLDLLLPDKTLQKKSKPSETEDDDVEEEDIAGDFVPWSSGSPKMSADDFQDLDPEKLAQALRHLDD